MAYEEIRTGTVAIANGGTGATDAATARANLGVGDQNVFYGTCSTAAATAAKTSSITGFTLTTGYTVKIKFTYSNTASNPTLNVNNTGAKAIYRYGTTRPGTTVGTSWSANEVVSLTYDGSGWQMNDNQNIALSDLSGTVGVASGGTGATTLASNAVVTGNGTSAVKTVATASGAFYATAANGAAKFGTLPIAQGGTGATTASAALSTLGGIPSSQKGAASGVASLDSDSKVPVSQMPWQYGTTDLTAGTSSLATGTLYFVYE